MINVFTLFKLIIESVLCITCLGVMLIVRNKSRGILSLFWARVIDKNRRFAVRLVCKHYGWSSWWSLRRMWWMYWRWWTWTIIIQTEEHLSAGSSAPWIILVWSDSLPLWCPAVEDWLGQAESLHDGASSQTCCRHWEVESEADINS